MLHEVNWSIAGCDIPLRLSPEIVFKFYMPTVLDFSIATEQPISHTLLVLRSWFSAHHLGSLVTRPVRMGLGTRLIILAPNHKHWEWLPFVIVVLLHKSSNGGRCIVCPVKSTSRQIACHCVDCSKDKWSVYTCRQLIYLAGVRAVLVYHLSPSRKVEGERRSGLID